MGEVAGIWPPGRPAHLGHVGDVIRSVIRDARGEAVARAVRPGLLDGMRELEERVEALYDEIIPEGEADYEEDAIQGISPGEKFEDGCTAEDIIKTAVRVPALIGRMEE